VVSEEEANRRIKFFAPIFEQLVETTCRKTRYPDDWNDLHSDEKSEFKSMRAYVGDLLLDTTDILGPDRVISILIVPLSEVSAQVQKGDSFDWKKAESSIYCIRSIHRAYDRIEDGSALLSLFLALPTLPSVPKLNHSVALMLGMYSQWLSYIAKQNNEIIPLIRSTLDYAIRGMQ